MADHRHGQHWQEQRADGDPKYDEGGRPAMAALVAEDLTTSTDLRGIGAPTPAPEGRRSHLGMGTDSCGFLGH